MSIPNKVAINIYAESANIKRVARLKTIIANDTRVRDCEFLNGFIGEGHRIYLRESRFNGQKELRYEDISFHKEISLFKKIGSLSN